MIVQQLYNTYQRYRTLQTHRISTLPIVILMPHSACNCKCVMCDIWKGNKHAKQLSEEDITGLLAALKKFGTQEVLLSGGEALLHNNLFRLCELLRRQKLKITLLSTGLLIKRHAEQLLQWVDEIIVSLDGDEKTHDAIRNIPGAYQKLKEGIQLLHSIKPGYPVSGRTVIHRLNFRQWPALIESAMDIGLQRISFLPADVSSEAFNRPAGWDEPRQQEILIPREDLPELQAIIEGLIDHHAAAFSNRFIAESPEKLRKIHDYYAAFYGLNPFPYKKCNAPWVSTVIEADGSVRPCFFHPALGNIHDDSLDHILNGEEAIHFRETLDMDTNSTCAKCVCYLNLSPLTHLK